MWRDGKADYYKDSRDFSHLLESRAESEHEPSKNRQDFLRRRQKINEILKSKEKVRPDQGPSSSSRTGSSSREPQRELPYDKSYGSFFGPSQPIVARRVLEEDRNRDEKRRLAAKMAKQANQARPALSKQLQVSSSSKTIVKSTQKPVKSYIKTKLDKVQKLKEARDYSFLFSEGDNNAEAAPQSKPNKTASSTQKTSSKPSGASPANPARAKPVDASRRPSNTNARPQSAPPQTKMVPKTSSKPSRPGTTTTTISASTSRAKLSDPSRRPTSNTNANDRRAFQQTKPATVSSAQKAVMKPKPGARPADAARRIPNTTARPAPAAKQKPAQIQRKRPAEDFVSDDDDDDDDGDNFNYRSMLPAQFRLDSRRRYDDDDGYNSSDMEANFSTIQAEEARSSRIAREEDERELKLLEEEERQERLRKKKRRM